MSEAIAFVLLAGVVTVAGVTDWRCGKVYNWLTYPAMAGGLLYWAIAGALGAPVGITEAFIALFAALVPFAILYFGGGLGGGDVKLMGAVRRTERLVDVRLEPRRSMPCWSRWCWQSC